MYPPCNKADDAEFLGGYFTPPKLKLFKVETNPTVDL
jgi:hypothetical protein